MLQFKSSPFVFAGITALSLSLLTGCGMGTAEADANPVAGATPFVMSGILHGGPNPIVGATVTLYVTNTTGDGAYGVSGVSTAVASTTSKGDGSFQLTLPTTSIACPAGGYAYISAYQGSTGGNGTNANSLLMTPIGACSSNYSVTGSSPYVNTYTGQSLWIDELTTAISAYALGNFMSVTNAGGISIGAPTNNQASTASFGSSTVAPTASGLPHAFANALALLNTNTGQPNAYTNGGSSPSTGGVVPVAEINLLGNILQACVNSNGVKTTSSSTSNDGTACGQLFSLTTPARSGSTVPVNTLQAMINLARNPNPSVNTWSADCTSAGSGTKSATSCLFSLAPTQGAYTPALTSAPPDWALAVVYTQGYGAQTSSCAGTCSGLTYPFYVALDYQDNVYVLNYDANSGSSPQAATTWSNIIGLANSGSPLFATPQNTNNKAISFIGTDLAGHVFGGNATNTNPSFVYVYSTTNGSLLSTISYNNTYPLISAADPFNNLYVTSYNETVNLRKFAYSGTSTSPVYAAATTYSAYTMTASGAPYQMAFDSNLDIYLYLNPAYNSGSGSPYICLLDNKSTTTYSYMSAAPSVAYTACSTSTNTAVAIPGTTGSSIVAAGVAPTSTGALAIGSNGFTSVTKSAASTTATLTLNSTTAVPAVNSNGMLYNRYVSVDGNDWGYSVDGANGAVPSGIDVFDSTESLALGTYKGCFVTATFTCGTGTLPGTTQSPMTGPRAATIDSSGDIWIVSGGTGDLTELIGAAAPTWPALSMAKFGLPQ